MNFQKEVEFFSLADEQRKTSFIFKPIIIYSIVFLAVVFFFLAIYDYVSLIKTAKEPDNYTSYYDFILDRASVIQIVSQWLWHPFIPEKYLIYYSNLVADACEKQALHYKDLLLLSVEEKMQLIQSVFPIENTQSFHKLNKPYYYINL